MNGHPTREEDFDLYALGVLEGPERAEIETHIALCAECTRELAEAQGRIARLAFAAPRVEPSPDVKQRLLGQIRVSKSGAPARPRGSTAKWWAAALVPAALALAFAAIFLWNENARLSRQLAGERASIEQLQKRLNETREITELIEDKDTMTVSLAPMPGMPQGAARVFFNSRMGKLMCDGELAPAPKNMAYQLWLVPKQGNPISAGMFGAEGYSSWMATVPKGVTPMMFAVTIEPAGGMPWPTGPKVMIGSTS